MPRLVLLMASAFAGDERFARIWRLEYGASGLNAITSCSSSPLPALDVGRAERNGADLCEQAAAAHCGTRQIEIYI